MKRVMVFGVFDGIHEGHRFLFREARRHGNHLIATVAQDRVVEYLKGCLPKRMLAQRLEDLEKEPLVDEVTLGDAELSVYEVVKKHRPDVIALGYDQQELKKDLESWLKNFDPLGTLGASWRPKLVVIKAHEPEKYHSSILRGKS